MEMSLLVSVIVVCGASQSLIPLSPLSVCCWQGGGVKKQPQQAGPSAETLLLRLPDCGGCRRERLTRVSQAVRRILRGLFKRLNEATKLAVVFTFFVVGAGLVCMGTEGIFRCF